jgi:hypothetical protein
LGCVLALCVPELFRENNKFHSSRGIHLCLTINPTLHCHPRLKKKWPVGRGCCVKNSVAGKAQNVNYRKGLIKIEKNKIKKVKNS